MGGVARLPEAAQPFPALELWLAPPTARCLCPWLARTEAAEDVGVFSGAAAACSAPLLPPEELLLLGLL